MLWCNPCTGALTFLKELFLPLRSYLSILSNFFQQRLDDTQKQLLFRNTQSWLQNISNISLITPGWKIHPFPSLPRFCHSYRWESILPKSERALCKQSNCKCVGCDYILVQCTCSVLYYTIALLLYVTYFRCPKDKGSESSTYSKIINVMLIKKWFCLNWIKFTSASQGLYVA